MSARAPASAPFAPCCASPVPLPGAATTAPALAAGLHLFATPIGNLRAISLRALETLAAADLIACEDTRVTRGLLHHYGMTTPLTPYHDHNAAEARPRLIARLTQGAAYMPPTPRSWQRQFFFILQDGFPAVRTIPFLRELHADMPQKDSRLSFALAAVMPPLEELLAFWQTAAPARSMGWEEWDTLAASHRRRLERHRAFDDFRVGHAAVLRLPHHLLALPPLH